jgi:hypothetical protein
LATIIKFASTLDGGAIGKPVRQRLVPVAVKRELHLIYYLFLPFI